MSRIPVPARGAFAIVTSAGRGAVDAVAPARFAKDRGGQPLSPPATRATRCGHSGLVEGFGRAHRARDTEGEIVRGRRSRVVLTPGDLAPRLAVMRRPTGARIMNCEATGAIVQRSPGRARRTPLKPSAQGRPGDRQHL